MAFGFNSSPNPGASDRSIRPLTGKGSFKNRSPNEGAIDSPSAEFAYMLDYVLSSNQTSMGARCGMMRLTMYSQKSEFGKVMIAWKEYGPEP